MFPSKDTGIHVATFQIIEMLGETQSEKTLVEATPRGQVHDCTLELIRAKTVSSVME